MCAEEDAERNQARGPMRKYKKWLGHWRPEYDHIKTESELMLMVRLVLSELLFSRIQRNRI